MDIHHHYIALSLWCWHQSVNPTHHWTWAGPVQMSGHKYQLCYHRSTSGQLYPTDLVRLNLWSSSTVSVAFIHFLLQLSRRANVVEISFKVSPVCNPAYKCSVFNRNQTEKLPLPWGFAKRHLHMNQKESGWVEMVGVLLKHKILPHLPCQT